MNTIFIVMESYCGDDSWPTAAFSKRESADAYAAAEKDVNDSQHGGQPVVCRSVLELDVRD